MGTVNIYRTLDASVQNTLMSTTSSHLYSSIKQRYDSSHPTAKETYPTVFKNLPKVVHPTSSKAGHKCMQCPQVCAPKCHMLPSLGAQLLCLMLILTDNFPLQDKKFSLVTWKCIQLYERRGERKRETKREKSKSKLY